jgi:Activator of Hsp90 ATPase homolog 1-like protein
VTLPPVKRSIEVDWDQEAAFRRFALEFSTWWPWRTHSVGAERVKRIVLEPKLGGRIFEEHLDGRRFQWGRVIAWEPPSRLAFSFHPGRAPETAQEVEVRFVPDGRRMRVELVATKWETFGTKAARARRGYDVGWGYVLNLWVGRRTPRMRLMDIVIGVARVISWFRGGTEGEIARARGEIFETSRSSVP